MLVVVYDHKKKKYIGFLSLMDLVAWSLIIICYLILFIGFLSLMDLVARSLVVDAKADLFSSRVVMVHHERSLQDGSIDIATVMKR